MVSDRERESVREAMNRVLSGETIGEIEYTAVRKDGSLFPVVTHAAPIVRDNTIVGIRGVAIDISDRKRSEEILRRSHDELETLVAERTAELSATNEQLRREIAERRKAEEAAGASEELFRAIFDSARDCIFIKDRSLRYTLVNPEMVNLLQQI